LYQLLTNFYASTTNDLDYQPSSQSHQLLTPIPLLLPPTTSIINPALSHTSY